MVELRAAEVESTDQRAHRAVLRIERNEGRLDLRQLPDLPALHLALHPDDRAAAQALLRGGFRIERAGGEAQSFTGQDDLLAGAQAGLDLLRVRRQHHCGEQVVAVRVVG